MTRDGATLSDRIRERRGPWPHREALAIASKLARLLARHEETTSSARAVTPDAIRVDGDGSVSLLDGHQTQPSPKWCPPAQADGAPWDAAANRYVIGLVLYRLIAGEHPFAGAGLRRALDDAAHREAPPFADAIARELPSGLQSFILRLIAPRLEDRPASAAVIATELSSYLDGRATPAPERASLPRTTPVDDPKRTEKERERTRAARAESMVTAARAASWVKRLWPLAAGGAVALGALAFLAPPPPKTTSSIHATPLPLVTAAQTTAENCASCHPRQAAEWRRSVMAHSVKSPLFNALESLIEEQVGRENDCPNGAGILRKVRGGAACVDRRTGISITGSGGEHWCVNCHSPAENLAAQMPGWDGIGSDSRSRLPVRDLIGERAIEGISCGFCHEVHGPVNGRGGYQGNPTWTSFTTGATFSSRPEDGFGLHGIANSGYDLRPEELLLATNHADGDIAVHRRPSAAAKSYLKSAEFCGSCHDVRLFGTDSLGAAKGEHFKRLRNAYSEWSAWAKDEERHNRKPATCQGCHMSAYPGSCEPGSPSNGLDPECPQGTHFVAKAAGEWPKGRVAESSATDENVTTHYFSGVDLPLAREFDAFLLDEPTIDVHGVPISAKKRRDLLLRHTFKFGMSARRAGSGLEIPIDIENIGAGHRVPAGFSQEREFWVHLVVKDANRRVVYEVGRVDRPDEDLHDKVFDRVNVSTDIADFIGRPLGMFGADVRDGPDVGRWSPPPTFGGTSFRGKGLINFQNGFLRCVTCIGQLTADGRCEPLPGQELHRADRFVDGTYDIDTGECRSNMTGLNAFFETYYPVGSLDASRGFTKGPDAIIDTRSVPPNVPIRYTYELSTNGARGPFTVEARLLFRAFPPFLIKGFAAYEREMARRGLRPSGPLVSDDMLGRLEVVELARSSATVP